jgi:hypothetical protein
MAKKSNVHPDHYKTAGREPLGQGLVQELEKQVLTQGQSKEKTARHKTPKSKAVKRKELKTRLRRQGRRKPPFLSRALRSWRGVSWTKGACQIQFNCWRASSSTDRRRGSGMPPESFQ